MKKLILVCGLLASGFSFGADWGYVVSGNNQDFYIDKSFYKYDPNTKTIDVWSKATKKKNFQDQYYTQSKTLIKYSCVDKTSKTLANVEHNENGGVLSQMTKPNNSFSPIFPDSIDESLWHVACDLKGKGLKFPALQRAPTVNWAELKGNQIESQRAPIMGESWSDFVKEKEAKQQE